MTQYQLKRNDAGNAVLYENGGQVLAWMNPVGWYNVTQSSHVKGARGAETIDLDFGSMRLVEIRQLLDQLLTAPPARDPNMDLALGTIREVNAPRTQAWHADGDPWLGVDYSNAMCGEAGEAANVVKKLRRLETNAVHRLQEQDQEALIEQLGDECADVILYLDLLAAHYGIDLAEAVVRKFNKTSEKFGFPHRMELEPVYRGM